MCSATARSTAPLCCTSMPEPVAHAPGAPSPKVHAARAALAFSSLQSAYFDARTGLYRKPRHFLLRSFEALWPLTTAWSAACSLAALPAEHAGGTDQAARVLSGRIAAAYRYATHKQASRGPLGLASTVRRPVWSQLDRYLWHAGAAYFDDNEWVALALLQQYRLENEPRYIDLARRVFTFIVTGWCDSVGWAHPGGIRWADAAWSRTRNTCSNGPAAEVAAELYLATGEEHYLDWSVRIYNWARSILRGEDGLYRDHVAPDGAVQPAIWSYNQGSMIGAGVLLHEATAEDAYLEDACLTAAASLAHYGEVDALVREHAVFVAVYLRDLLILDEIRPDPRYRALAESYASNMWEQHRQASTGLYLPLSSGVNGTAPLVAIEALLAGSPPRP